MIVIYHHNSKATQIWDESHQKDIALLSGSLPELLFALAQRNPERLLVWCHEDFRQQLNKEAMPFIFHHKKMLVSFNPSGKAFLTETIGYIEESSFIKVNPAVRYPTWLVSSAVGGIDASVLNLLESKLAKDNSLDYFLNSMAKLSLESGLFCYSDPELLVAGTTGYQPSANNFTLFRFVKQHYRTRWVLLMLLNLFLYERRLPLLQAVWSLFYKNRTSVKLAFGNIRIDSDKKLAKSKTVDVIIPTIGREKYLYDFLKDLAGQTIIPQKVIIVEQNPLPESRTALGYLENEPWPFRIRHFFTHQAGACNARNLALDETESDWVFFADDDIRIAPDFLEQAFAEINPNTNHVFNFCCLLQGQPPTFEAVHQTSIFGAGCSMITRESLGKSRFGKAYEFGFSEDFDFGSQLMNKGFDTYYLPQPQILHLKAPVGGFRAKPGLVWEKDEIRPKPSPTVMLYKLLYHTKEQLLGYKTNLFIKNYLRQSIKNPFRYYSNFQKQWQKSMSWANHLQSADSNIHQ